MNKIYVYPKECQTADGRKFTAWETTSTASKKRCNVCFVQGKCSAPSEACTINVIDGNVDKSRRYPCIWVNYYEIVDEPKNAKAIDELNKFING